MPSPDNSTQSPLSIAEMAKEYDIKNPLLQLPEDPFESDDDVDTQDTELAIPDNPEAVRTVRQWSKSSKTRATIIAGIFGGIALGVISVLHLNFSSEPTANRNETPQEEDVEQVLFATDGEFAAQATYAKQDADFQRHKEQKKKDEQAKALAQAQARKQSAAQSQSNPQRRSTPASPSTQAARPTRPPRTTTYARRSEPTPNRVYAPTKRTAVPSVVERPPQQSRKPVSRARPPAPIEPAPSPVAPSPDNRAPEPAVDPTQAWMVASMSGAILAPATDTQFPASDGQESIDIAPEYEPLGISIPGSHRLNGTIITPVSFDQNNQSAQPEPQMVIAQLDDSEFLPAGTQLLMQYFPPQSVSKAATINLDPVAFRIDGYDFPVESSSMLIGGKKGQPLIAKQGSTGGGFLNGAGKIFLGAGRSALGELTRPRGQSSTTSAFGSSSSVEFGDRNPIAAFGSGAADQALQQIESNQPQKRLTGVFQLKPQTQIEVSLLTEVQF